MKPEITAESMPDLTNQLAPQLTPNLTPIVPQSNWLVLKFGGSSVGDPKHWPTITQQVELTLAKACRPFLVLSALKNVSNLLEALLHQALAGVYPMAIEHLKEMHLSFAAQIGLDLSAELSPWFAQLSETCQQIYIDKNISPKLHAKVLATGELLSSTIGCYYLKSRNINCDWQDARSLLKSDGRAFQENDSWHHYTNTICHYKLDKNEALLNLQDHQVIVTQGFIASDEQNDTVLLGREGSDTSAAYFGALLNAKEIQIWTDVPGIFSTNPRDNNQARLLHQLNYSEAKLMAQLGAKVLHPRALQPALDCLIPIMVKSTHLPEYKGSLINATTSQTPAIKSVVNESPVISFGMKTNGGGDIDLSLLSEALEKELMSLGYDLVIKETSENSNLETPLLIMRYANSDLIEPNLQSLDQLINQWVKQQLLNNDQTCRISVHNKLSLISIVGINYQPVWQLEVEAFCQQQTQLNYSQLISSTPSGRVSLLVTEEQSFVWRQLLHKKFIEDNNFNNEFGETWASFC